jgi:hypothetical protein
VTQSYPPGVVRGLRSGAGLRGRSFISTGGSSGLCIDGARRRSAVMNGLRRKEAPTEAHAFQFQVVLVP